MTGDCYHARHDQCAGCDCACHKTIEGGTMNSKITKEGKARWAYKCMLCNETYTAVDQFRAIEYQQRHERTTAHQSAVFGKAVDAFGEAWLEMGRRVTEAFKPFVLLADAFTGRPKPTYPTGNLAKQHRRKRI